jgi:hypothetical protein
VEHFVGSTHRGPCVSDSTLCVQHGAARIFHKMPPGFGQFHCLMIAHEKAQVDLRFKLDNPLAQRRLLDAQPRGCTGISSVPPPAQLLLAGGESPVAPYPSSKPMTKGK